MTKGKRDGGSFLRSILTLSTAARARTNETKRNYFPVGLSSEPPPPGRRTMAHRSHGHMGRQGEGSLRGFPPSYIHIYIYTITKAIPSCPWCLLRLHPLRLCVLLLHLFLLPVLCKNCFEGTPPWAHMSKIFKYIYVVEQALLPSPGERWAMR